MRRFPAFLMPLLLSGCVTPMDSTPFSTPGAGFETVQAGVSQAAPGRRAILIETSEDARATAVEVTRLVKGRTISVDTAVQVALLNDRGLQAAYADIGISAAEAWQETLPVNPKASIGVFGIAHPELGLFRSIEAMVTANILSALTREKRVAVADARFRVAQQKALLETLTVIAQTRRAWIDAVGAFERVYLLNMARTASDAASEMAQKLGETGAWAKDAQGREHAFNAELSGQVAEARLAARLAKEELARAMGLWGADLDFFVPDRLPKLPKRAMNKDGIEREAVRRRVDLQLARLELEATALSYGLTDATRYLTDLELMAGVEIEREIETEVELDPGPPPTLEEHEKRRKIITPQVELEFVIPIFDSGEARLRKAELTYLRAANILAQRAVTVRSEARSAYTAYRAGLDIARHYANAVVPLRTGIAEEALLDNNGMINNTFELLADTRAKINAMMAAANAKREFWQAEAGLTTAVTGGGRGSAGAGMASPASAGDGGDAGGGH